MHSGGGRGHLHGQAVGPPERVTVSDYERSRLHLPQQADGCNTVSMLLAHALVLASRIISITTSITSALRHMNLVFCPLQEDAKKQNSN